jgi:hypothetical protein
MNRAGCLRDFRYEEFRIQSERERYASKGVTWPLSIPLMPGTVKLAIIVRDKSTGRVGSLTIPVDQQ